MSRTCRFQLFLLTSLSAAALTAQTPGVQGGSVTGQVRTLAGVPAVAIRVAAVAAPPENIRRADGQEYVASLAPASTALTNNDGRYRLANIPPGRYYIQAGAVPDATYYPGTATEESAAVITIASGSTTPNLDLKLLKAFGGIVSGQVRRRADAPEKERAILSGGKLDELLETPVDSNGGFAFGHVPTGVYLLSLFPNPPGMASRIVRVGETDVTGEELVPPPTRLVTGRIVVQTGPLPHAILQFDNPGEPISGTINPDGSFSARVHAARHVIFLGGLPTGYDVVSIRVGSEDVSRGLVVGNTDVSGVVITVTRR